MRHRVVKEVARTALHASWRQGSSQFDAGGAQPGHAQSRWCRGISAHHAAMCCGPTAPTTPFCFARRRRTLLAHAHATVHGGLAPARGSNPCRNSLLSMSTIKTDFARIGSHRRLCPPNVQMPSRASFTSVASRGKSCRAGSTCRLGCSSGGGSSSCSNRPGRTSATFSYTRRCASERTRGDEAHKQAPSLPPC